MSRYQEAAPHRLYRISFGPNGTALRSWHAAKTEDRLGHRTFGHRWDDPERQFRSLYMASSLVGAFIETLQDLRPNLAFLSGLRHIALEPGEVLPSYEELDPSYFDNRFACDIAVRTQSVPFVNVAHVEVISIARDALASLAAELGIGSIDAAAMLGSARELTQAVARMVWLAGYAGVAAPSVLGQPHRNWTAFETGRETDAFRLEMTVVKSDPVGLDHPDLIDALNALHMSIDGNTLLLRADPRELAPPEVTDAE